ARGRPGPFQTAAVPVRVQSLAKGVRMRLIAVGSLTACLILSPGWSQPSQAPQAPSARQSPAIVSPEVTADHHVTFRLLAPKANEVILNGEFMSGNKTLQKAENGLWSLTVGPLEPEIYNYNFTIDGVRTIDPNNPRVKTGSTPSTIM